MNTVEILGTLVGLAAANLFVLYIGLELLKAKMLNDMER